MRHSRSSADDGRRPCARGLVAFGVAVLGFAAPVAPLGAQSAGATRTTTLDLELLAGAPATWADGGSVGPSITGGIGGGGGLTLIWRDPSRIPVPGTRSVGAGVLTRVHAASIEGERGAESWSLGSLTQIDVGALLRVRVWESITVDGEAGGAAFAGADDVSPFRDASVLSPFAAMAVALPVPIGGANDADGRSSPWSVVARLQWLRLGGARVDDPVPEPGVATRLTVGVRYAP